MSVTASSNSFSCITTTTSAATAATRVSAAPTGRSCEAANITGAHKATWAPAEASSVARFSATIRPTPTSGNPDIAGVTKAFAFSSNAAPASSTAGQM